MHGQNHINGAVTRKVLLLKQMRKISPHSRSCQCQYQYLTVKYTDSV